jgi:hypothetical protein
MHYYLGMIAITAMWSVLEVRPHGFGEWAAFVGLCLLWPLACRDSDGTATAAINEDLSVPKDCQARAEGIAQSDMGKPITDAQTPGDTPHDHR